MHLVFSRVLFHKKRDVLSTWYMGVGTGTLSTALVLPMVLTGADCRIIKFDTFRVTATIGAVAITFCCSYVYMKLEHIKSFSGYVLSYVLLSSPLLSL